ncbi:MAG: hypothetical protein ACXVM0_04175 [Flavisolibacter sp.]
MRYEYYFEAAKVRKLGSLKNGRPHSLFASVFFLPVQEKKPKKRQGRNTLFSGPLPSLLAHSLIIPYF